VSLVAVLTEPALVLCPYAVKALLAICLAPVEPGRIYIRLSNTAYIASHEQSGS